MFGAPKSRSQPPPEDEPSEPPPDYGSLVERQLRIDDGERAAQKLWAEILTNLQECAKGLRYTR